MFVLSQPPQSGGVFQNPISLPPKVVNCPLKQAHPKPDPPFLPKKPGRRQTTPHRPGRAVHWHLFAWKDPEEVPELDEVVSSSRTLAPQLPGKLPLGAVSLVVFAPWPPNRSSRAKHLLAPGFGGVQTAPRGPKLPPKHQKTCSRYTSPFRAREPHWPGRNGLRRRLRLCIWSWSHGSHRFSLAFEDLILAESISSSALDSHRCFRASNAALFFLLQKAGELWPARTLMSHSKSPQVSLCMDWFRDVGRC